MQPIQLGVTFSNAVSKLKAQSSNFSFHWNVAKEMFELWALIFRKWHQAEWERQARTGHNQSSIHDVCKTTLACSTLGSSAAMLTMVKSVKSLTKSVVVPLLDNQNRMQLGKVHGNAVYQLNSLMETKWHYKNWCLWKECHTPHLMVITTTVKCE